MLVTDTVQRYGQFISLKTSCVGWLQETYSIHRENKMLKSKLADVEGAMPKGMEG